MNGDNPALSLMPPPDPSGGTVSRLEDLVRERTRELQQSEKRFRDFAETSSDYFFEMDENLRFSYFSHRFEEITGVSPDRLLGKTRQESGMPGASQKDWRQHLADLDARRPFRNFIHTRTKADGSLIYLSISGVPHFDDDDVFKGYRCTGCEITEQKLAEEAHLQSEARLAAILEIAPEAVIAADKDMTIRLFNKGAERIFGYDADEILGRDVELLIPPQSRESHRLHVKDFERSANSRLPMDNRQQVRGLRKDGTEFPAAASVSKLELGGDMIFTVMLRDVTEQRNAEAEIISSRERAEAANRAKSEFLANMSHELRTPLNSILGFSQMLQVEPFGPLGDAKYLEYISAINTSGSLLLQIITDILDISRIEAGETTVEDAVIDLPRTITECLRIICARAKEGGLALTSDIPDDLPQLRADPRHVKQIVLNLLSNAIKFTPDGGSVAIRAARTPAGEIEVAVTDTGIGITADNIPHVLQPFAQVAASDKRSHGGTGLGLPICKSLMELHGGVLTISSVAGAGTTVTVRFPPQRTAS